MNDQEFNRAFGVTRFTYTKKDVDEIYALLVANDLDIIKVFDCVWLGSFSGCDRSVATCVLRLIGDVKRRMQGPMLTDYQVWDMIESDARSNTCIFEAGKLKV